MSSPKVFSSFEVVRMSREEILRLGPEQFRGDMTLPALWHLMEVFGAVWFRPHDPREPHIAEPNGGCSNGFVDTAQILKYPNLRALFARLLVRRLRSKYHRSVIEWVASSNRGESAAIASAVAECLSVAEDDRHRTRIWKPSLRVHPGEVVLQVEDQVADVSALQGVRNEMRASGLYQPDYVPFVLAIVRCHGVDEFGNVPILHLVHYNIRTWTEEECPYCQGGTSERIELDQRDRLPGSA